MTSALPEVSLSFRSDMTTKLIRAQADDDFIVQAARVSTLGSDATDPTVFEQGARLINFLIRDRHGCYSDDTEVLTADGWKAWPQVEDGDSFATLDPTTSRVSYQKAQRVVRAPYSGEMYRFKNKHLDLLVTPNHNMLAALRLNSRGEWSKNSLVRADSIGARALRIPKAGGKWEGEQSRWLHAELQLLGFFIGDGNQAKRAGTPSFNIRKAREIAFLEQAVAEIPGASITESRHGARYVNGLSRDFRELLAQAYDAGRSKVIPVSILNATASELDAVLDGMLNSDGRVEGHKREYFTTSRALRDGVMELAMKLGIAADYKKSTDTRGKYAGERSKPVYKVSFFSGRNASPRLGWTVEDRKREVTKEPYNGFVYCATVPNGTLFVRRAGKTAWCGNSPFEHCTFTFYVEAPIFVWREVMRHRLASYNEESGRYKQLAPVFYIPSRDRNLIQVGKPGAYSFEPGSDEQYETIVRVLTSTAETAYAGYVEALEADIAREVSRMALPLNIYSSAFVTMNARALTNFLSLRTKRGPEEAKFPSFPQREIELVADGMEAEFARLMPVTHEAWSRHGRVPI